MKYKAIAGQCFVSTDEQTWLGQGLDHASIVGDTNLQYDVAKVASKPDGATSIELWPGDNSHPWKRGWSGRVPWDLPISERPIG